MLVGFLMVFSAQGQAFHADVAHIVPVVAHAHPVNVVQIVSTAMMVIGFDLEKLLLNEKITHITINATLDATFLLTGAILLFLSYIFRHGEQLQQLSDETL